jgi:hypothetical protein
MSRHGYSDECENVAMWRGVIASASRGKRGQAFFRALVEALDAMPDKRLIADELQTEDGEVCGLGCLARVRGLDLRGVDAEDWSKLGEIFDIASQLAQEVMFMNDAGTCGPWTPENRWRFVRDWAARQIRVEAGELQRARGT